MDFLSLGITSEVLNKMEDKTIVEELSDFLGRKTAESFEKGLYTGMRLVINDIKDQIESGYELKTIISSIESNKAYLDLIKKFR